MDWILDFGSWLVIVACSRCEFAVYLRDWGSVLDAPLNCLNAVKTVVAGWIPIVATVFSHGQTKDSAQDSVLDFGVISRTVYKKSLYRVTVSSLGVTRGIVQILFDTF